VTIAGFAPYYQSIVMGLQHTGVLLTSGLVFMWGSNQYGQLGIDSTNTGNFETPSLVTFPPSVTATVSLLAAGAFHTGAIMSDTTLWMWGQNTYGQLGNGGTTNQIQPSQTGTVLGLYTQWSALALGVYHSCGYIGGPRRFFCWGFNNYCAVGASGSYGNFVNPYELTSLLPSSVFPVTGIALGYAFTAVLAGSGSLYMWGLNQYGILGTGTADPCTSGCSPNCPSPSGSFVPLPSAAVQVSLGASVACALLTGGTVYCWGYGVNGQLGIGTIPSSPFPYYIATPNQVPGLSSVSVISAGYAQVYAVSTGGTVYEWGSNVFCEGLSTTTFLSPTALALQTEALLSQGSQAQGGCIVAH